MEGTGRGYGDIQKAKFDDVSSFVLRDNDNTDPTTKELILSAICIFLYLSSLQGFWQ